MQRDAVTAADHPDRFRRDVVLGTTIATVSVVLLVLLILLLPLQQFGGLDGDGAGTGRGRQGGQAGGSGAQPGTGLAAKSNDGGGRAARSETDDDTATTAGSPEQSGRGGAGGNAPDPAAPTTQPPPQPTARKDVPIEKPEEFVVNPILPDPKDDVGTTGDGTSSEFFGIKAKGRKFVYIVDRSSSMQGQRFDRARQELMRSLRALDEQQSFYVYFFSTGTMPMFSPDRDPGSLIAKTAPNLKKTERWVKNMSPSGGTNPESTILEALRLKPDAIFFLSDGGFAPNTADVVQMNNPRPIPINTIGFEHRGGEPLLQKIARQSGGKYRFVP